MARRSSSFENTFKGNGKKKTSIGKHKKRSRPKNKSKKRNWKKYKGQGK